MIDLEVCINSDGDQDVADSVGAAYSGGAARIELCAAMDSDGLTPTSERMKEARQAFADRPGVMVMIRPRAGDFCYTEAELNTMGRQIKTAAQVGADGVVFGVLRESDRCIDTDVLERLVEVARKANLTTTFHRAFDATPDPLAGLQRLIDVGVDRVLTCGVPWGQPGTAVDGLDRLVQLVRQAGDSIEIVIGGCVHRGNVKTILRSLPIEGMAMSVHAYSGAQEDRRTTVNAVRSLVYVIQEGAVQ